MKKASEQPDIDLPRREESAPGAPFEMRCSAEGDVTVRFGDGSEDLNVSRRDFMRIAGAAAATAAMTKTSCRNPKEEIVPYLDRPDQIRIGQDNFYATACTACPNQCGMLVRTRAGRPFKLEGNPQHPVNKGALCARGQSHYLDLYDPDRVRTPLEVKGSDNHRVMSWDELDRLVVNRLKGAGNVRILTGELRGPSEQALLDEIEQAAGGKVKVYSYQPLNDELVRRAHADILGDGRIPHYRFDKAEVVLNLGCDFLGTWRAPVEFARAWAARRDPTTGTMSRVITFEGVLTLTGSNSDDHYRVRTSDLPYVALALANEIIVQKRAGGAAAGAAGRLGPFTIAAVSERTGVPAEVFAAVAQELIANRGKAMVVANTNQIIEQVEGTARGTGLTLQKAVVLLNLALDAYGNTVEWGVPAMSGQGSLGELIELAQEIANDQVDLLIIGGQVNPVYSAPPELNFAALLERVPMAVSLADRVDETAIHCNYLACGAHDMETWGDVQPWQGVYTITQPTIRPLYEARGFADSLIQWFGATGTMPSLRPLLAEPEKPQGNLPGNMELAHETGPFYRYVQRYWRDNIYNRAQSPASFDRFWQSVLRAGVFVDQGVARQATQPAPGVRLAGLGDLPTAIPARAAGGGLGRMELTLLPSIPMYDGRHANNPHLQEHPDPITQHVWGPVLMVSPKTFLANDLELGQLMRVRLTGADLNKNVQVQVIMQPGVHDDVVGLYLGYGRTRVGVVGNELTADDLAIDVNAYDFTRIVDRDQAFAGMEVVIEPTDEVRKPAVTQGSQMIDLYHRSNMIATTTLDRFKDNPSAGIHAHPPLPDLWEDHNYGQLKWGMSIDMTRCTGCSACSAACQEENNIPVVGRQGIIEGREMQWLRIDRYYALPDTPVVRELTSDWKDDPTYEQHPYVAMGEYLENPRVLMQPMLCQHCENAPCETVCPVLATMHSSDGLNQMAYNRCVGTRYCSNNCPYKVRRFNWYNYTEDRSDSFFANFFPEMVEHGRLNVAEPLAMQFNPDVTVRSRGVMEKCTFCVQRIRRAKWQMKKEARARLIDGEVQTACQQTCPTNAISFGNLLDRDSEVYQKHNAPYSLSPLAELGVASSIAYITSVWNTERLNPDYPASALVVEEHHGPVGHATTPGDEDKAHKKAPATTEEAH